MKQYVSTIAVAASLFTAPAFAQAHDHGSGQHTPNHSQMNHGAHHMGGAQNSMLKSSTPADGAVLQEAPATLALTFAHPVVLQNVTLVNAAGKTTKVSVPVTKTATDSYQLKLPKLAKGAYTVNWNAGGDHLMSGRLNFQVR